MNPPIGRHRQPSHLNRLPEPGRRAAGVGRWLAALVPVVVIMTACGGIPGPGPPEPPACTHPAPVADPVWTWTADQVKLSWPDMPVEVCGGDEAWVLRRRAILDMPEGRTLVGGSTFLGFDLGNRVEADFHVYDHEGRLLYSRSPHYHGGCENPDCYDAREPFEVLEPRPISRLTVDTTCRVVETNAQGRLSASCHHEGTFQFQDTEPPEPPPGPSCDIPGAEDPGWGAPVSRSFQTRQAFNRAKILVGDRCGQDPLETLALIAAAANAAGDCAAGPWDDEVVFRAPDGLYEGYHAVAFGNGCYTGNPERDAWPYLGQAPPPGTCGPPTPPPLHHFNLKFGEPWSGGTPLVGPDPAYCRAVGYTDGRSFCAVRPDCSGECPFPDREACEELVVGGDPLWRSDGRVVIKRDNPYLARCCLPSNTGGKCQGAPPCSWLEICNAAGLICDRVEVNP